MTPPQKHSLADKLKSLGVKVGMADLPASRPPAHFDIGSIMDGAFRSTRSGDVFVVSQRFPADHLHGKAAISIPGLSATLAAWAADPRLEDMKAESLAFLDTETSGLSGGTGTLAFMVGVARFAKDELLLEQFFLRDPAEEPAMLEAIAEGLERLRVTRRNPAAADNGKT